MDPARLVANVALVAILCPTATLGQGPGAHGRFARGDTATPTRGPSIAGSCRSGFSIAIEATPSVLDPEARIGQPPARHLNLGGTTMSPNFSRRTELSATDCYRRAWDRLWAGGFVDLLLPLLALALAGGFGSWLSQRTGWIGMLYQLLVGLPVGLGAAWVYLRAARGETPEIADVFFAFRGNYKQAVVGMALLSAIVGVGMLLLVVPGVIAMVRLCLVPYLLAAENYEAVDALRESWQRTAAHAWSIFGVFLMSIPILLVGALLFGIGLIPAAIWIHLTFALLYLELTPQSSATTIELKPPGA